MGESWNLIWLVLGFPFVGFLVQALFGGRVVAALGREKGAKMMGALAVLAIAIPFLIALKLTMDQVSAHGPHLVTGPSWIKLASLNIPFEWRVDTLSLTMVLVITGIGALIHLYATGYMSEEKEYTRFFTYLNLFVLFMLILVLGGNLALLFIGWEGVGLCSYLLIGFWYKDLKNSAAANKAFIVNRIGDWGLTLGLFMAAALVAGNAQSLGNVDSRFLSYDVLLSAQGLQIFASHPGWTTAICLLLFVGAMGKSAQFPLYLWLPDAMAGPTPVSALIHAATMVTSGVVLLNRMAAVFALSPIAGAVIALVGAFTAIFAALIAFGQTDIKKVLAYSTVSQLGYMFIACGVGAWWVGMFHVITHAFFKALLFLGSGAVIHAMAHEQDMRWYGKLKKYIPITTLTMTIGWAAIAGVPGLSGFWSKEAILGNALGNKFAVIGDVNLGLYAGYVALFVAFLTAAYMTRMTWLTFFGNEERWRELAPAHEDHGHEHHEDHAHHEAHAHDHGPDTHGFFYTDEELAAQHETHEHHHHLDSEYTPHEVPKSMWIPLAVLAVLSLGGGFMLHNNHTLMHWLGNGELLSKEVIPGHPHHGWFGEGNNLMIAGVGAGVLGILLGWAQYWKGMPNKEKNLATWAPWRKAAGNQFGYDETVMTATCEGGGHLADRFFYRIFDARIVDGAVNGIGVVFRGLGGLLGKLQTGFVRGYALMMLLGSGALIGYLAWVLNKVGGPR